MANKKNVLAVADAIENLIFPTLGWNPTIFYWGPDTFYGPGGESQGVIGSHYFFPDYSGRNLLKVADVMGWAWSVEHNEEVDCRANVSAYLNMFKHRRQRQQFLGIDPIQYIELALFYNHPMMKTAYDSEWVRDVTREQVVKTLRHLAKTGEVVWN